MNSQQFKVGDWITRVEDNCSRQIISISENYYDMGKIIFDKNIFTYKLWQPQPNEWCWLYGKLIKLTDISSIEYCQYITSVGDNDEASYEYLQANCEPFIGILPTFLKDE